MRSPPHPWGIQQVQHDLLLITRITPTPVGNTLKKRRHTGILKFQNRRFL
ncbi:hypothetical protein HMPREF0495_01123 [Levilactobacillus brevis ATCC 14869 = DSM 20054]|uniref:Uncharacterized protein n=1 Tax=Levilactobacillus brevis ATCC 14869 = DSM 20054 TaxID=649758 RepID=U2PK07_LEVBR|nr:hypothetical protein HMPREF0495_01123 [Levilactobacillus brevis ATCC 14869 = DSM 20054]